MSSVYSTEPVKLRSMSALYGATIRFVPGMLGGPSEDACAIEK